jgi:hypothetical protein
MEQMLLTGTRLAGKDIKLSLTVKEAIDAGNRKGFGRTQSHGKGIKKI